MRYEKSFIRIILLLLPSIILVSLFSSTVLAETNITLLYGWNGTHWVPLKTSADGTLQTDLNLTRAVDLWPKVDNAYDLGTGSLRWRSLYVASSAYLATASGSIGIGTASPISTLDISGNLSVSGSTNSSIDGSTFFVDATNNNVGIGTTSPGAKLEVKSNTEAIRIQQIVGGSTNEPYLFFRHSNSVGYGVRLRLVDSDGSLSFDKQFDGNWVNNTIYLSATTGNVGINTTSPSSTLTVGGGITSTSATAGIGYATGAGGAVTQATSRTTGVTLNKITGTITTDTTSLAANAYATFVVTNSAVAIGDTIIITVRSGNVVEGTTVTVYTVGAGSFGVSVRAGPGGSETGAIIFNFAVIKAVSS